MPTVVDFVRFAVIQDCVLVQLPRERYNEAITKDLKLLGISDLVKQGGVTVVGLWAPWCGYCVRMMPIIEEIAGELEG